jgi:hypothetical protein
MAGNFARAKRATVGAGVPRISPVLPISLNRLFLNALRRDRVFNLAAGRDSIVL